VRGPGIVPPEVESLDVLDRALSPKLLLSVIADTDTLD
jgi:hypothetical protein